MVAKCLEAGLSGLQSDAAASVHRIQKVFKYGSSEIICEPDAQCNRQDTHTTTNIETSSCILVVLSTSPWQQSLLHCPVEDKVESQESVQVFNYI